MNNDVDRLIKRFKTNDPFEIAKRLNIIIKYEDMDLSTRGFYFKILRRKFIVINSNLSYEWMKYVCAHELGHERLHPKMNRFQLDKQSLYNSGKFEMQAHRFAIKLLTHGLYIDDDETQEHFILRAGLPLDIRKYI